MTHITLNSHSYFTELRGEHRAGKLSPGILFLLCLFTFALLRAAEYLIQE
jgi:hypothetical protein